MASGPERPLLGQERNSGQLIWPPQSGHTSSEHRMEEVQGALTQAARTKKLHLSALGKTPWYPSRRLEALNSVTRFE
jgi:hypothetical protein